MTKKDNQTSTRPRPAKPEKKASASARSKLLTAVSLLGVSLGASDAAPLDGSGPAASVKDAAAGEKLLQSVTIKFPPGAKSQKQKQSKQLKLHRPRGGKRAPPR